MMKAMIDRQMERLSAWIHSFNPYDPNSLDPHHGLAPVAVEESSAKDRSTRIFVVAFILFAGWSAFAPIDSGVTVQGTVVVMGNRQLVQHPTGGVVEALLVREGDTVKRGDVLLKINRLNTQSNFTASDLENINAALAEARLLSERMDSRAIKWPDHIKNRVGEPQIAAAVESQSVLFTSRRNDINGQISGIQMQIQSQGEVLKSRAEQLKMLREEAKNNAELADEGHVPRSKANEAIRLQIDTEADIASLRGEIGRNLAQIQQIKAVYHKDVETQLTEAQKLRQATQSKSESLAYDLALTEIKAPTAGVVVALKANTVGGVIQPGQILMEIVPQTGDLVVEADVPTNMIDKVRAGLEADLRFSAFNLNTTPVVPGRVKLVGADKLPAAPPARPVDYYLAQIETTAAAITTLGGKTIQPGMPVEVIIKTGERTFLSYLIKPITDRFARSFKD